MSTLCGAEDPSIRQRAIDALLALPEMSAGATERDSAELCAQTVLDIADEKIRALEARLEKAERDARNANADADMYARAWQRELGDTFVNKRHHIDAMVLTTRRIIEAYKGAVARGLIRDVFQQPPPPGTRAMVLGDIGMGPKDVAARRAVAEIAADLRGRKLLSYLFEEDPDNVGAYGHLDRALDIPAQREIFAAWEHIIREALQ